MKIDYSIFPRDYHFFQRDKENGATLRIGGKINYEGESDIPHILLADVISDATGVCVSSYCDMNPGNEFDFEMRIPCGYDYRISLRLIRKNNEEWISYIHSFRHIAVGDIFVIAGQSNAVGYGRGNYNIGPDARIYNFKFKNVWSLADNPLHDTASQNGEQGRREGDYGPHITMAKKICGHTGIPVGFIPTAVGGSCMDKWNIRYDGDLYRAMTERIKDSGNDIAGIIWYQGESDTNTDERSDRYKESFSQFISDIREELGDENLKIFVYQLNRALNYSDDRDMSWSVVRDSQRKIAAEDKNTHITSTFGAALMEDGIHNAPSGCDLIGERMAAVILKEFYGIKSIVANAPNAEKAEKTGEKEVTVYFGKDTYFASKSSCCGEYDFRVQDSSGDNPVTDIITEVNKIILTTERCVNIDSSVFGGYGSNPKKHIPVDIISKIPMLSFIEKLL